MDSLPVYQSVLTCPPCTDVAHHFLHVTMSIHSTAGAHHLQTRVAEKAQTHFSLAAVPKAACTAKQSKKRKNELEKTPNKK